MNRVILGESLAVKQMIDMINRVSSAKTNVLVIGESGTGKELVARMIHNSGPLKDRPFIPVNCGAIPETLIESEMFGHKRGSFTGAISDKAGLFEAANGGTLFLDEVGELPLSMQVKLLRAIQERVFRKVGGTDDVRVDIRIIAATNRDLEAGVKAGTFREDLYYRLNVILIKTPPLRERKGDVRLLMEQFAKRYAAKMNKTRLEFEPEAAEALERYAWPGNVRELENVIERALTLGNGEKITFASLPDSVRRAPTGAKSALTSTQAEARSEPGAGQTISLPFPDFSKGPIGLDRILGEVEKIYLDAALAHAGGVKKKAADLLGITFRSIRYRLAKLGVAAGEGEEAEE